MTVTDKNDVVSICETKNVTIDEPSNPELVNCDIVARPDDPYGCSVVVFGNDGLTKVKYSNTDPMEMDLPGI